MDIVVCLEFAVFVEGKQVHRRKVTGRVVKEHVFRAWVRTADRAIFRAGVPGVDRIVVLDARVGTGPSGVAYLLPQITSFDRFGDFAVLAADQFPVGVVFDGLEEGVGHTDRVVRVLARDRGIGFAIPVGVVGRELDRGIALLCVVENAFDVSLWDCGLFRVADRRFQRWVDGWVVGAFFGAIKGANRREDAIELFFVHLRAGDDGRDLLFFDDLPVDEFFNIRVVGIDDHHLRCSTGCPARFDRAGCAITNFQEAHEA